MRNVLMVLLGAGLAGAAALAGALIARLGHRRVAGVDWNAWGVQQAQRRHSARGLTANERQADPDDLRARGGL